ncbi:unnamed protein product [Cylicocyclus nassatus]|uniref:SCP domain-containing protein n=1 Tax=Cylicocyclus nassatus TaxID=53992 RepID=A0AA36GNX5_CYLNA|nr:unnamed protein product [Cylicocyclus nassatus]
MKKCKRYEIDYKEMTGEELNIDVIDHSLAGSRLQALRVAIYKWWYTVKEHDPIRGLVFTKDLMNKTIKTFTRMAWDTTSHLGCYVRNCSDGYHVSCVGNIVDDLIYEKGRTCSLCRYFDLACGQETRLCIEKKKTSKRFGTTALTRPR